MNRNAVPALVVVVALAGLVAFGGTDEPDVPTAEITANPAADPTGTLSSSWFCPSAQGGPGNDLASAVDVANVASTARTGTVTWRAAADGAATTRSFTVAPGAVLRLRAVDAGPTPAASALVETVGGGVVVEQAVSGARGASIAPCASDASPDWYLANGTTLSDATEVLSLFNPFPADAVVDTELATDQGREAPGRLQGLVVPAGTTKFVQISEENVRRQEITATAIRARTGQLVVSRLQSFDGSLGRTGVSVGLAARAPAEVWSFAFGVNAPGVTTRWHVFNPGEDEAEVSIEVMPYTGDTPEPIDVTVPARSQVVVALPAEEAGVAPGVGFSSTVRSGNGVAVVAERSVDARAPYDRRGWSSSPGVTASAGRWVLATGAAAASGEEWVVVFNPGATTRRFSVVALGAAGSNPLTRLQEVALGPAAHVAFRLLDHVAAADAAGPVGVGVSADGPVVVERIVYGTGQAGLTAGSAVALAPDGPG